MKFLIDNRIVLSQAPKGPLATCIEPFAKSMRQQGYARYSLHRQVLLAACFSEWLRQQEVALRGITSDHPQQYLRYRARQVRPSRGDSAALQHLLDFLQRERLIPAEKKVPARPLTSAERCAQAYEQHLREARGLATAAVINYVPFIRSFLKDRFGSGPVALSNLCAATSWICAMAGTASAPQTSEAPNQCATLLPAICALSR